jgi:serine/threonine protein kinase
VKITDFGISRASDDVQVTKTGLIAGTPAYLAPEVAYGKEPTPPTDVFSLGSTLYAAVEGEPPFGLSENTLGLLHAVAAGKINPPRYAGPLAPVLISLLATEAEDRPTAAHARDMLAAVARGENPDVPDAMPLFAGPPTDPRTRALTQQSPRSRTGVRPAVAGGSRTGVRPAGGSRTGVRPAAPPPPPSKSRRPLVIGGVALALVIGVGGYLIAARGGDPPRSPSSNVNSSQTSSVTTPPSTSSFVPETETSTTSATVRTTSKVTPPKTTEPSKTSTTTTTTTSTSSSTKSSTTTTPPSTTSTTSVVGGAGNGGR